MKTVVRVKHIEAGTKTGMSIFHGEGDAVKGFYITFEVTEGSGMFYAGQNEGVAINGRSFSFWFAVETAGQALYALQQSVVTENYAAVEAVTTYRVDTKVAQRCFAGYTGRLAALADLAAEEFSSADEAQDAVDEYRRYNSGTTADMFSVVQSTGYSEPVKTVEEAILNLTQHAATAEQTEAGVVEPENKAAVQSALTFDAIPTASEMVERAAFLSRVAIDSGCKKAMIGGAPFFMAPLERALIAVGITPVYAFSVRDSKEEPDGNGGVRKVNVFRHVGFVEAVQ